MGRREIGQEPVGTGSHAGEGGGRIADRRLVRLIRFGDDANHIGSCRIAAIDDAQVGLAARHEGARGAHIGSEHEMRLQGLPDAMGLKPVAGIGSRWDAFRIADDQFATAPGDPGERSSRSVGLRRGNQHQGVADQIAAAVALDMFGGLKAVHPDFVGEDDNICRCPGFDLSGERPRGGKGRSNLLTGLGLVGGGDFAQGVGEGTGREQHERRAFWIDTRRTTGQQSTEGSQPDKASVYRRNIWLLTRPMTYLRTMAVALSTDKSGRPVGGDASTGLVDPFGRRIDYLRVSVTDRCDLRCVYCMSERQTFLPRSELLTIEELDRLCSTFVRLGTRRLRLSGGEPLVRRGLMELIQGLSRHLETGALDEITLTTNGTQLARFAPALAKYGVRRINVSIDSLDPDAYRRITRGGDLAQVLEGLEAARAAGLRVRVNIVALKTDNADELMEMIGWIHGQGMDAALIETMPLGEIEADRTDQFLSLEVVRRQMQAVWTLTPVAHRAGGPARYVRVEETGGLVGFITPLSHNFCEACNRVRVTCAGTLFLCLGQADSADLKAVLRASPDDALLEGAIREALSRKPKGHDFDISRRGATPAVSRPMSMTGG